MLTKGDPAPWFICASSVSDKFNFQTVGGRYIVLCFYGSATVAKNTKILEYFTKDLHHYFDDDHICFFGVTIDPRDREHPLINQNLRGIRYFWDFDGNVSSLFGALESPEVLTQGTINYNTFTLILDPNLRIIHNIPINDPEEHNRTVLQILSELPGVNEYAGVSINAPVLIIPRIFEQSFCRQLISKYEENGGSESGFMREKDGKTVGVIDYSFKRRQDYYLERDQGTESICSAIRARIVKRLLPEIKKAYQFNVTRMERYLIACYDGESGGFFRPHRDNTTKATAYRRFACTINLNSEEYEGGDLRFPEFGDRLYRAPTGGAVVFSCSLLHEATPVTKGRRYAFLPFFYDEEAAKVKVENAHFLSEEVIRHA